MKINPVPFLAVFLFFSSASFSQVVPQKQNEDDRFRISLKSGSFIPQKNIGDARVIEMNKTVFKPGKKSFVIIQFEKIPTSIEKEQLKKEGIELLEYVPNNAYTATVTGSLNTTALSRIKTRAIVELTPEQKMEPSLANGIFPSWAVKAEGTIDVWVSFPKTFSFETVSAEITAKNFDIVSTDFKSNNIIALRIATNRLKELASFPFIDYVQTAPKGDEPLNFYSTALSRANTLSSSLPAGRNLKGDGIVVGVGDLINPWQHFDLTGRFINRSFTTGLGGSDYHGLHVAGTIGGAGIIQEVYTGYAPKSKIITQFFSGILAYAPEYVQDHGMVITNNSYGNPDGCASYGVYDLVSRFLDQQAFQLPNLQHVFSAGNSGNANCSPYPAGYANVLGGYQSSKNPICVGSNDFGNSSKGPVKDGRIKPEIVAQGIVTSLNKDMTGYRSSGGTSHSSPGVSGGLALLYQRYKQLNSGSNPKSGLMKTLLCNGAIDIGNAGVDFHYGFGLMNLLRSVTMLENTNYFNTSVNTGDTNTHTITLPGGSSIAQLKVMLYWNDSAAAPLAATTLVNDLDLQVTDPSAVVHLPQLLNTNPPNVALTATTGADHLNNIEQVVINNPAAGTYTFSVNGTTIPSGANHEYFLAFDTIPVSTKLTYPLGGEHLRSGDNIRIGWDSYGNPANDFTLQYSIDNGTNWIPVTGANIAANLRQFSWTIPAIAGNATSQARVKIIHNGTGIESISDAFTIVGVPQITLAPVQCEGYIALTWPAITGATDYEIMLLQGEEMVSVGTTASLNYTISGLSKDSLYWVSLRSRVNGMPGRRDTAISRQPNTGTCAGTISDNDLKIDTILSPAKTGRKFTSTALSATTTITIRIENLDDTPTVGDIPVTYIIGANPPVTETIFAPNIAARASYTYSFFTPVDLSVVGSYDLKVYIAYPGDQVPKNDTIEKTFKQLDNPPIDLTSPFMDDIEAAPVQTHSSPTIGLDGLDRYDLVSSTPYGQLRTFVNSGIAYSGSKALTIDADRYNTGTADSLTATFNLQNYDAAIDDVRLSFVYKHHDQQFNAANKLWIRGDDLKPWEEVFDLYNNQGQAGVYNEVEGLEIGALLDLYSQNFSSSFQLRWGQWGQSLVTDNENAAGYTIDDIRLFKVSNDIKLVSIDTPVAASCGLDNAVPVKISVRNSASTTIFNIPVTFQIGNNTAVTETIPSLPPDDTISYTFTATADLSAFSSHTVKVWVDLPTDSYRANDTASVVLFNSPLITTFPYLQDFEASDGSWHSAGINNSWEYGTPTSTKINGAASGSKAWKTNLANNHNNQELSYLYSPCFNITGMTKPMLSLSIALDLEDCGAVTPCDLGYVEYSSDGNTWVKLGTSTTGTNWYNKSYSGNHVWNIQNYTRWHVATIPLPTALDRLRLRFVMESDQNVNREGMAIDDIHIYDSVYSIYNGPPYTSPVVTQATVNGSIWINFESAGKIIASVNPNGQDLGSTDVQAYINTGAVRINTLQYYHNRNITIKPTTVNLADSATVRFYFLDAETETLINATGCSGCSKPASAFQLGVTKYSNTSDALENGTLADNTGGNHSFITPANVKKVPFDKGYYAEFKVMDFSEFWLNNGGPGGNQSLPVELISFTVNKNAGNDVVASWATASENNTARFEIELARENDGLSQNNFIKIGEVSSQGNSTAEQRYQFTDTENNKSGVRYYRLRIVDHDGQFTYSTIRAVVFDTEIKWQVYPNPSPGLFNLAYQLGAGQKVTIKVYDINGKLIKQLHSTGNAFIQKISIDLSGPKFATGIYLLEVGTGEKQQLFRLLKR